MKTVQINEELRQAAERAEKRYWDEYLRKHIEHLKQTGEYDELVKKRQAVLDAQKKQRGITDETLF